MRLAVQEDLEGLRILFAESTKHANQVGHIDRPDTFNDDYFTAYIEARELYCFDTSDRIAGAARLTETDPPPTIWEDNKAEYLYVGKLATSSFVRNTQFFPTVMLPEIVDEAKRRDKIGIRLSCLADNPKLIDFYNSLGYDNAGVSQIFSSFYKNHVYVTKFELGV